MNLQKYRSDALKNLTPEKGVYALCDLDNVPIYIGISEEAIRARVRRHLTSARSDVIANRQLDVWEVAYVWAWPMGNSPDKLEMQRIESYLINHFHGIKPLMNPKIPPPVQSVPNLPTMQEVRVLPEEEITSRRDPARRLPRQVGQFNELVSYMLEVKDTTNLRRTLSAHFGRLYDYYWRFLNPAQPGSSPEVEE